MITGSCTFTPTTYDVIVDDLKGKPYRLYKDNLENEIDADSCKYVVKANKVLAKLAKKKASQGGGYDHWNDLISKKKKKKASAAGKEDPVAGIMDLMKDMYDSGGDEMKKMVGETMMTQRGGKLGNDMPGMGGMGGMGDMDG